MNYNENSIHHKTNEPNFKLDFNLETQNNSIEILGHIKRVVDYNTNFINKKENEKYSDINIPPIVNNLMRNKSEVSNFSQVPTTDNIKILNEFKNNIEDKILNLKKKIVNNSNVNYQFISLNYEKFRNLKAEVFLNMMFFFDTNDILHMFTFNRETKKKVVDILIKFSKSIVKLFDIKYLRILRVEEAFLMFKKVKKNKKGHLKINLVLKSKIMTNNSIKDKSITIGFKTKYQSDKENLKNIFKFDVVSPGPLSFWIMREYTEFHQDELDKAYFQHIMKFCMNDYIETTINIFTEKGLIDFNSFKWMSQNIQNIPNMNFLEFSNEHNKNREVLDFDLSRFCEMEIMKNKWSDISNLVNHENILIKIKSLFEPTLLVQKVLYDDVGYFLFKIFLVANTKGKVSSAEELGIQLEVISTIEKISNEVKKNCLIFDRKNELQCRVGDLVIFYISKNK